jgi:osmotically-inducible protein OsmY
MRLTEVNTLVLLLVLLPVLLALPQSAKAQAERPPMPAALLSQSQQTATPNPAPPAPTPAPQDKREVNSNIQSNLNSVLSGDPVLSGASIDTSVDDVAITLNGTVQSEGQRRRALDLASQYSQYRKIVDKLVVK